MYNLSKPQKQIYDMDKYIGGAAAVICGGILLKGSQSSHRLQAAVSELYRCNDALRIQITETADGPRQTVSEPVEGEADVLEFGGREELDRYAAEYAAEPIGLYGKLCEIKVVVLEDSYGLLVKLHHIIGDAWTMALIGSQFRAVLRGEKIRAYSYLDFLEEEKAYLGSPRRCRDRAFFLEQFRKCGKVTYLSGKEGSSFAGARETFVLDAERAGKLRGYAAEKNTSVYVLFLTAFAVYLNRIKENPGKFYLGTAVLNRMGARAKNTMGMYVNTVPVLMEVEAEASFSETLSAAAQSVFAVLRHQKYNYGDILSDIRKECDFPGKLYDVVLSYQNAVIAGEAGTCESTWYHSGRQSESLQIHIDDRDGAGTFTIQYDYRPEHFSAREIRRTYGHVSSLLFDAVENDGKKICDLQMLTSEEERKILYEFNDTAVGYEKEKSIPEVFLEQVLRTPERTAVIACDRSFTYRELNGQADRIANALIAEGVRPGDRIAFVLPRKSILIAVMFGILKAGAAYLPVDPEYPGERIRYMLEDSGAKFCITEENVRALAEYRDVSDPAVRIPGDQICYCIYTSGSTGKPKGTLIRHSNVLNLRCEIMRSGCFKNCKTMVSVQTVSFDLFTLESIVPVLCGVTMLFADEEQSRLQPRLNHLLCRVPADVITCTPTKMKLLSVNPGQNEYLKNIKVFLFGGEALEKEFVRQMYEKTSAKIVNTYGPTETTVYSSCSEIPRETEGITIGRPIANTQIYIVDSFLKPVPVGITGELCIAGDGVGAGYLGRPELTAEKFVDNPFGSGKLYRTGDLACWREDGTIVYVGRNDFQVKIRGLRIELGEIENALMSVEGIFQAAAAVRENAAGRQMICAFYTGREVAPESLRGRLAESLPQYMLPHIFVHLAKLPVTVSGKTDRNALPVVDLSGTERRVEYRKPEGELERRLARLLGEVLEGTAVGRLDHFFDDLGCDSLKAIEFVTRACNEGIYFSVQSVFDHPTIEKLGSWITEGGGEKTASASWDFSEIDELLSGNREELTVVPAKKEIGNLLLAGATGYLGIHILADFLEHDSGIAFCLVRRKDGMDGRQRLWQSLAYYFGNRYEELAEKRVRVLTADVQQAFFGLTQAEYRRLCTEIGVVVNAAASVKHYGMYSYFYEKNVETVKRIVAFSLRAGAQLIHISTISVSGFVHGEDRPLFDEGNLDIGQSLDSVYIRSKFEAELEVLAAMQNGLSARIMRMGNLTNRFCDGLFQENYASNAFLKRLRAILALGVFPGRLKGTPLEFTPVDDAAAAVMTVVRHLETRQKVFHINHPQTISMEDLAVWLGRRGYCVRFTGDAEFADVLRRSMEQSDTEDICESLIGDLDENHRLVFDTGVRVQNRLTVRYLEQIGFRWKPITEDYLEQYFSYFERIGYFCRRKGENGDGR